MTPATARDLRRRAVAELRAAEPGLSLRQMADRLNISRDTVTRDLEALDRAAAENAPPAEAAADPVDDSAPQASMRAAAEKAPVAESPTVVVAEDLPPAEASDRPAETVSATLPRRVADPLADMDVSRWRALRRDLALLAQTGDRAEALVHQAVVAVAHAYRQALARGDIAPGVPFLVRSAQLTPLRHRAKPAAPVEGA